MDKPIQKKTLHAGKGEECDFPDGTKIKFHFVTKLRNDDGTILDDSRQWEKPMELIIGKKFKLEAWEMCLKTMRMQEVSSFVVKRVYACEYPAVAKTLRDTFGHMGKKKDPEKIHKGHMCGMMAMQMEGGLGYDDLNELMKNPQDLEFILEILSIELPDQYKKESWQMDPDEKLNSVPNLKEEGNNLYKAKQFKEASVKYSDAIGMLEQLMLREKPHDDEWLELQKQKVPLLLNFSQCKLLANEFYPVIEHCTEVLDIDPGTNPEISFLPSIQSDDAFILQIMSKLFTEELELTLVPGIPKRPGRISTESLNLILVLKPLAGEN